MSDNNLRNGCPDFKILNPVTGRCIKDTSANRQRIAAYGRVTNPLPLASSSVRTNQTNQDTPTPQYVRVLESLNSLQLTDTTLDEKVEGENNFLEMYRSNKVRYLHDHAQIVGDQLELYYDISTEFQATDDEETSYSIKSEDGSFILTGNDCFVDLKWEEFFSGRGKYSRASFHLGNFNNSISVSLPTVDSANMLKNLLKQARSDGKVSKPTRITRRFPFFANSVLITATKVVISKK